MEQISTTVLKGPPDGTWALHRSTIKRLYLEEHQTLPQVMDIMKRDYDFKASIKMYKRRLKLWKFDGKNLKRTEVKQIARQKVDRDAVGKLSTFFIKDREVDMDKIRKYLKKHGISSLEEMNQAASPVVYDNDVVCKTPGCSPMSSEMDIQGVERQDIPPNHDVGSVQYDQSSFVELSMTGRRLLYAETASAVRHFLSMSPETRSRQLLSLSPVPRTLAMPKTLSLPEQMLSTLSLYLKGSFEAGVWETGANGLLCSKKSSSVESLIVWVQLIFTAVALHKKKDYVQFRQMLSQACKGIELYVKLQSPNLISDLLYAMRYLHVGGLREISDIILNQAYNISAMRLKASHPLTQIFGMLRELGESQRELQARLLQCQLDHLEKEVGPWHFSTAHARGSLLSVVDTSEAVGRARASLEAYKLSGSEHDDRWLDCMENLAGALMYERQYETAKRVFRDILDDTDAVLDLVRPHGIKARAFWKLSHIAEWADNDMVGAESYTQQAVVEAAAAWGWGDAETIRFMSGRADLLRMLGRLEEADRIELRIQDLLGSPVIEELLE